MKRHASCPSASGLVVAVVLVAGSALADVSVTDVAGWKAQQRAANEAKKSSKRLRRSQPSSSGHLTALGTGSQRLVDASGLEYFINTNISYETTASASGAMSEASFTGPVQATTSAGGTVASTLSDAFDGYNSLWFSQTLTGPAETGNAAYVAYNGNGSASLDSACAGRRVVFPNQAIYGLTVSRRVFVPANDSFARWETILTNPTAAPITVNVISANDLGSDTNTLIDSTSSGDATATTADTWVTTWQNWSGTTSSDPRLAHVLWGPGGTGPSVVNFTDGDDSPYWTFHVVVPANQTRILLHFVTGHPSKAAARAKATQLAANPLTANAAACLNEIELTEIVNFASAVAEAKIPALDRTGLLALVAAIAAAGFFAHRRIA
jgi:hypothetical protein